LPEALHPEQRLRAEQVFALTGRRRSWIYKAVAEGRFPAPERDGKRCSRWRAGTVLDWLKMPQNRACTSDLPRPTGGTQEAHSRAAAAALGCKLVADLTAEERSAWEAAGRPGHVVSGRTEFVPIETLVDPPPGTRSKGRGRRAVDQTPKVPA